MASSPDLPKQLGWLASAVLTFVALACGGETVAPSCTSLADSSACAAQPACVWLYDRAAPRMPPPEPGGEDRHPACFEAARTGVNAVCAPDETRVTFFTDECWRNPCTADIVYDDRVSVCWKDGR